MLAANTKATQTRAPEKINTPGNTDKTALPGTRRRRCYDGRAVRVISDNADELGRIIWLAMIVQCATCRLVTGRSHHRPRPGGPQQARSALPAVAWRDKRDIVISSNNYRSMPIIHPRRPPGSRGYLRADHPVMGATTRLARPALRSADSSPHPHGWRIALREVGRVDVFPATMRRRFATGQGVSWPGRVREGNRLGR